MNMRLDSLLIDSRPRKTRSPAEGFESILADLKDTLIKPISLAGLSDSLFTLGTRQSWQFGYNSLSQRERQLYSAFSHETVHPMPDADSPIVTPCLYIGVRKYGKPVLITSADEDQTQLLGFIPLDSNRQARLNAILALSNTLVANEQVAVNTHFNQLKQQQQVATTSAGDFILIVKHGIDHIDPILIYVHDSVFTNFSGYNNLLGKNSSPRSGLLLDDLLAGTPTELSDDARTFLVCFYFLKRAGFRGEEFNGQQLTLASLNIYFKKKLKELAAIAGVGHQEPPSTIEGLADLCRALKLSVRKTHFTYRKINGLCFFKSEHYAPRTALNISISSLPSEIHEPVSRVFGLQVSDFESIDGYFRALVEKICDLHDLQGGAAIPYVEQLLELVVKACIYEVNADIGMTRGYRDWRFFQEALAANDTQAISDAPSQEYFCAVFCSEATRNALNRIPGMATKVLKSISQRMVFNSWHYTPGHFAPVNDDGHRHFYFPPRMSDTAVWSDQHHAGHVLARVRYSIRSPASLMISGRKFPGVIDIRLMKSEGSPFTDSELMRVREYTAYIRAIHQALADLSAEREHHYRIALYDKRWYEAE